MQHRITERRTIAKKETEYHRRSIANPTFEAQDENPNSMPVVVVNQALAKRFWTGSPIGRRVNPGFQDPKVWCTIVGVVEDTKNAGMDKPAGPELYFQVRQVANRFGGANVSFVVRAANDSVPLQSSIRNAVREMDPTLPVYDLWSMEELVSKSMVQPRFLALLLATFSGIALFLAAIGIYGVMSYSVAQRTQEIGVRMALGARPLHVMRLVVGQSLVMLLIGAVIGLAGAFALTRLMSALLFGVTATDPATFGMVVVLLPAIALPKTRRKDAKGEIVIRGARENNLKNIDVAIPLGTLTAVTGVSGSGKSTLVNDILYRSLAKTIYRAATEPGAHDRIDGAELIDKVIEIDQSPIGRTPRSNPATYTGLFTFIRDLFAMIPDAKTRGFRPGRFSFNVKGGRCEACQGDGVIAIEMHFLPDVYVTCEQCKGRRYNRETLEVRYKGRSIADVLELTVAEALEFFESQPRIRAKLELLNDVGLGYIHLGQSATTLSGGEAQRVKLATELAKRDTGRTLYILDEPTTGLHFEDVRVLLEVLHRLVDKGNSVLVIEHNLDVIKTADWVVDLGPEGGQKGGMVVAQGTPEEVARVKASHTGQFLRRVLNGKG